MDGRNGGAQALSRGLHQEYKHEAAEHRRILFERGSGLSPSWKDFRNFLQDLGPSGSVGVVDVLSCGVATAESLAARMRAGALRAGARWSPAASSCLLVEMFAYAGERLAAGPRPEE